MLDSIVESIGEAAVETVGEVAGTGAELVVEGVAALVEVAVDAVTPDREESSEEPESPEEESNSQD